MSKAAGSAPASALETVLDSVMAPEHRLHRETLIQHLVTNNPSLARSACRRLRPGSYSAEGRSFGGQRATGRHGGGDPSMKARIKSPARGAGKLREPALMFTAVLR